MSERAWCRPVEADERRYPPELVFEAGERNHHISNTSYPISHGTTWKPYRVPREQHRDTVLRAFDKIEDLCLYSSLFMSLRNVEFVSGFVVDRQLRDRRRLLVLPRLARPEDL